MFNISFLETLWCSRIYLSQFVMLDEVIISYFAAIIVFTIISNLKTNEFQFSNISILKQSIMSDFFFIKGKKQGSVDIGDIPLSILIIGPFFIPQGFLLFFFALILYVFRDKIEHFSDNIYNYCNLSKIEFFLISFSVGMAFLIKSAGYDVILETTLLVVFALSAIFTFFKEYFLINYSRSSKLSFTIYFVSIFLTVFFFTNYLLMNMNVTRIAGAEIHFKYAFIIVSNFVSFMSFFLSVARTVLNDN